MDLEEESLKATNRQWKKAEELSKELESQYNLTASEIQRAISEMYIRYGLEEEENKYFEADKYLNETEYQLYRQRIEEVLRVAVRDKERAENEYNRLRNTNNLTRREAYQNEIEAFLIVLGLDTEQIMEEHLMEVYVDTYKRYSYNLHRFQGVATPIGTLQQDILRETVHRPYSGLDYSDTIWKNTYSTSYNIRRVINDGLSNGKSYQDMAEDLSKRMKVSHSSADLMVRNETSYVVNEASAQSWEESGTVQQYRLIATLDSRTTQICRDMDREVFDLDKREKGENYPPFHHRCRTTAQPVIEDDLETHSERLAKHPETDKWYNIPANISYRQWESSFTN